MGYFDIRAVSNSSLNYIDPDMGGSPRYFKKFLDGDLEDFSSKALEIGTLIHAEILEPGTIDMVPSNTPGPKTAAIVDALFERLYGGLESNEIQFTALEELSEDTWETIIPDDFYGNHALKTRINRVIKDGSEYWQALIDNVGKTLVDVPTYHIVQGCIESLKYNPITSKFLLQDSGEGYDVYNEYEIAYEQVIEGDDYEVTLPIKCKIDRFVVNHDEKSIIIVDLKTTSKPLGTFDEEVYKRRYNRQLAFYSMCLQHEFPEYEITGHMIVAVQTNKEYPCEMFYIDKSFIQLGIEQYSELLQRIAWHMHHNVWANTMEQEEGQIRLLKYESDNND